MFRKLSLLLTRSRRNRSSASKKKSRRTFAVDPGQLWFDRLEDRVLLAGDVSASITGDTLVISGDAANNAVRLTTAEQPAADVIRVGGGTTSVSLDTDLLLSAASLDLSSATSTGTPATGFAVGFPIESDTSFEYTNSAGFAPESGFITHTGTVGFNDDAIIVGDFRIGFDAGRVAGSASGFFVEDTVGGLGILFDIGANAGTSITATEAVFVVESTDLLVSPEFASALLSLGLATADLTGADVGDAQVDATAFELLQRTVESGVTSVSLDTDLLANAASLVLSSATSTGTPATGFDVGFPIGSDSDLAYTTEGGFTPTGGVITHTGTVGFNGDSIVVGDFEIGFDASRATGAATGFFVADTVAGLGVLFDIGANASTAIDAGSSMLGIESVDLLVSPEFAQTLLTLNLASTDLAGADVGDAQVDAAVTASLVNTVNVRGLSRGGATLVNGERDASFELTDVSTIDVSLGDGRDALSVRGADFSAALNVDLGGSSRNVLSILRSTIGGGTTVNGGDGRELVFVTASQLNGFALNSGDGLDRLSVRSSTITGLTEVDLGGGSDFAAFRFSDVGAGSIAGGGGLVDRLLAFRTDIDSLAVSDFDIVIER